MEKHQVAFDVYDANNGGPVGKPIVVVFETAEGNERQLVFANAVRGRLYVFRRTGVSGGILRASQADSAATQLADDLYNWLMVNVGFVEEFEIHPGG